MLLYKTAFESIHDAYITYVWCPANAVSIDANFTNFIFNFTLIRLDYLFQVLIILLVSFLHTNQNKLIFLNNFYFLTKM